MVSVRRLPDCDARLLLRFRELADESAFEEIVHRYSSRVFGVCLRVLKDRQLAEDATQDAFVTLARYANRIQRPDALASWLHGVAFRKSIELRRKRQRDFSPIEDEPATQDMVEFDELCEIVDEELGLLPTKYRIPLQLHYYDGLTVKEIAARTRVAIGTLSTRLQTGRRHLRERLKRRGVKRSAMLLILLFWWSEHAEAASFFLKQRLAKRAKRHIPRRAPVKQPRPDFHDKPQGRTPLSVIAVALLLVTTVMYSAAMSSASAETTAAHSEESGWGFESGFGGFFGRRQCNL